MITQLFLLFSGLILLIVGSNYLLKSAVDLSVKLNLSSINGVKKWSVDGEKCFSYWAKIVSDCMICMRVCPYNKDFTKFRQPL